MSKDGLDSLVRAVEGYLREVVVHVLHMQRLGLGTEVLGPVPGRPESEDVEIGLDRSCQQVLERWLGATGHRVELYSEHGLVTVGQPAGSPGYLAAADPFDGSGLFRRGVPAEWWSVVSVFDPLTLEPLAGGAVDILRRELYMATAGGVTAESLDKGVAEGVFPSGKTAMDDSAMLAAYLRDPSYLVDWTSKAARLLLAAQERWPGVRIWPNGGSCIYPWLARGRVDAYLMFDEPRSEIDPGLAFSRAAGYPVYAVESDGSLRPYRFAPSRHAGRVPVLLAACTEALARDIVGQLGPLDGAVW